MIISWKIDQNDPYTVLFSESVSCEKFVDPIELFELLDNTRSLPAANSVGFVIEGLENIFVQSLIWMESVRNTLNSLDLCNLSCALCLECFRYAHFWFQWILECFHRVFPASSGIYGNFSASEKNLWKILGTQWPMESQGFTHLVFGHPVVQRLATGGERIIIDSLVNLTFSGNRRGKVDLKSRYLNILGQKISKISNAKWNWVAKREKSYAKRGCLRMDSKIIVCKKCL